MKNQTTNIAAIAEIEGVMTELIPVESTREQLEAEVEKVRAKKLHSLAPELKPLDKSERALKKKGISILMANRKVKGFFPKGKKSRLLRSGLVGIKKGPAHIKQKKGVTEEQIITAILHYNKSIAGKGEEIDAVEIKERLHRTKLRQTMKARPGLGEYFAPYFTIVQREHGYMKTKVSKRSRPSSAKGRSRSTTTNKKGKK